LARRRQRTHTASSVVSLGLIGNSAVESRGEARVRSRAAAKSEMGTCEVWLCFGVQDVQRIRVGGAVMARKTTMLSKQWVAVVGAVGLATTCPSGAVGLTPQAQFG
jgi:hypothetical protein